MDNFRPRNHEQGYGNESEPEILKIISEYGYASDKPPADMKAKIKEKGLKKIYEDLMRDAVVNPSICKGNSLVLQHILYFQLEKINKEYIKLLEQSKNTEKVPDLMNREGSKNARELVSRFRDYLSDGEIKEIIKKFHVDLKYEGSKFGEDYLRDL